MGCCQAPENASMQVKLLSETDDSCSVDHQPPAQTQTITTSYQSPVIETQTVTTTASHDAQAQKIVNQQMDQMGKNFDAMGPEMGAMFKGNQAMTANPTDIAGQQTVTINASQEAQAQQMVNQQMNQMGTAFNAMGPEMGAMFAGTQAMMNVTMAPAQSNNVSVSVQINENTSSVAPPSFTAPYLFAKQNTVVIQHKLGKYLRVKPGALGQLDPDGATGGFAQWQAEPLNGGAEVKLKSLKTGKYLRIHGQSHIDVGGGGGAFTVFIVHKQGAEKVKLESKKMRGKYIAVQGDNEIRVGTGGKWTELNIYRKASGGIVTVPTTTVTEVASNETCVKCKGRGYVHESTMDHKTRDPNKRCFFCEECTGCKGSGSVVGTKKIIASTDAFGHNTVQTVSSVNVCASCSGRGWKHTSNMDHKTGDPEKKCFFCEDCDDCGGRGR